ncbi:MAG: sigma-70 family RNA polymerase sigma factor [Oscillospiraceae bacterium]
MNVQKEKILEKNINKYKDMVYRLAFTYLKNSHDADDITQEVFLKYVTLDKTFQSDEHLKSWLITVTINHCKNLLKSSWFKKTQPLDENIQFEQQKNSNLYHAVMTLSKDYRTVIYLFYYEDYSTKEIASMLGKNESTIRSHLARARKKLKNILLEDWKDE